MTPPRTRGWTTPADVVATLRTRWQRGGLLADVAHGRPVAPQRVPVRGPAAREVAARFAEVQQWVAGWDRAGAQLRVERAPVGGRLVGVNQLPVAAWVDDESALWRLLGVRAEVDALGQVLDRTAGHTPELLDWVRTHPQDAVAAAPIWRQALDVVRWVAEHGTPQTPVRQVDVPGVDTKFVEKHRALLARLLDVVLPPGRIDADRPRAEFAARYRLATKPSYVRLRRLDGAPLLDDWPPGAGRGPAELTLRAVDLAAVAVRGRTVVVVENEATYLALPALPSALAVFGGGYAAARLGAVGWLSERDVLYWGDLDTHGFAILDGLLAAFPHTRPLLMDRATLELHREHWGSEAGQVTTHLANLPAAERELHTDLVEGRYGPAVRLEQERIRFGHAARALEAAVR